MSPAHVQLLARFRIEPNPLGLPAFTRPRQQAFLAYLLLHCRQPQARQTISATFWPDSPEAQASKNLRVLLVEMRQVWSLLDQHVKIERSTLHWLPNPALTVDVLEFEAALLVCKNAQQHQEVEQQLATLRRATTLYRGDLLPHLFEDWVQSARSQFSEQFKDALGQLARLQQERGCFADAAQAAQRLQQYDPLSDLACRLLLECYPQQGETTRALQAYQTYAGVLLRELGVEPEAGLKARYLDLLRQQRQPKTSPTFDPIPKAKAAPTLVGRADEWRQLTALWRNAHRQAPPVCSVNRRSRHRQDAIGGTVSALGPNTRGNDRCRQMLCLWRLQRRGGVELCAARQVIIQIPADFPAD